MKRPDWLKVIMVTVGAALFTVGALVAYFDAAVDYRMGWVGGFGALCAGIGVGIVWVGATLDSYRR